MPPSACFTDVFLPFNFLLLSPSVRLPLQYQKLLSVCRTGHGNNTTWKSLICSHGQKENGLKKTRLYVTCYAVLLYLYNSELSAYRITKKTAYDWNKLERKKENDFKADKHGRKDKCTNM